MSESIWSGGRKHTEREAELRHRHLLAIDVSNLPRLSNASRIITILDLRVLPILRDLTKSD